MQLSLLPALEARSPYTNHVAKKIVKHWTPSRAGDAALPAVSRPTSAQINYLKRLTGIRADGQLQRYVARKIGKQGLDQTRVVLTKQDFAQAIDRELNEKRWVA